MFEVNTKVVGQCRNPNLDVDLEAGIFPRNGSVMRIPSGSSLDFGWNSNSVNGSALLAVSAHRPSS